MSEPLALGLFPVVFRDDGRIDVRVTYLDMAAQPRQPPPPPPHGLKIALWRLDWPSVGYYRYLYDAVGGPWVWVDRKRLRDDELSAVLTAKDNEVHVLHVGGAPAGFFELDRHDPNGVVNLAYFGLAPEFIGLKLGRWFLRAAIDAAWTGPTRRVTVNTCTLDHPRALALYQGAGFAPIAVRDIVFDGRPFVGPADAALRP